MEATKEEKKEEHTVRGNKMSPFGEGAFLGFQPCCWIPHHLALHHCFWILFSRSLLPWVNHSDYLWTIQYEHKGPKQLLRGKHSEPSGSSVSPGGGHCQEIHWPLRSWEMVDAFDPGSPGKRVELSRICLQRMLVRVGRKAALCVNTENLSLLLLSCSLFSAEWYKGPEISSGWEMASQEKYWKTAFVWCACVCMLRPEVQGRCLLTFTLYFPTGSPYWIWSKP